MTVAAVGLAMAPAAAHADAVTGSIEWGFKDTWRTHVLGAGSITADAPATADAAGIATFPLTGQTGTTATSAGAVFYNVSSYGYSVKLANLTIVLDGSGNGELFGDITFDPPGAPPATTTDGAKLATLTKTATVGDITTFSVIIADVASTFGRSYVAGETPLDSLTLTIMTTASPSVSTPVGATQSATGAALPQTGTSITAVVAVGTALVVAGAYVLVVMGRRRGATPTA
jgi:LPXTG-motif cell wall-anchored protein